MFCGLHVQGKLGAHKRSVHISSRKVWPPSWIFEVEEGGQEQISTKGVGVSKRNKGKGKSFPSPLNQTWWFDERSEAHNGIKLALRRLHCRINALHWKLRCRKTICKMHFMCETRKLIKEESYFERDLFVARSVNKVSNLCIKLTTTYVHFVQSRNFAFTSKQPLFHC